MEFKLFVFHMNSECRENENKLENFPTNKEISMYILCRNDDYTKALLLLEVCNPRIPSYINEHTVLS